ncbi:MAG: LLM class flavin-dependent oxidoreductase [Actinomycetota bacterium]|nr:LLM class flavin-dependent oxidoreductase [Actinomycetota bacterium]
MKFGIFLAPFHMMGENPTLAIERDLELIAHLDRLGFDEAWIGEHHSAGSEIIAMPEIFIAAAAERTKRIRLGTGVTSLPYHHPLLVADRMVMLDHMTRGRAMLGCGPGALPSDAHMMGIDPLNQRQMMEDSLEAIIELLTSPEPVTRETEWFTLRDARLQIKPYTRPHFQIAVAGSISPSGPKLAGRFGVGLLSLAAMTALGFDKLKETWGIMSDRAAEFGVAVDRANWRVVGPMHIADSKEQALKDVEFGIMRWFEYLSKVAALPLAPPELDLQTVAQLADLLIMMGVAVIGTPDEAIAQIERLQEQAGGFGTYLLIGHEWARREETFRSYELFARHVMPHFQDSLGSLERSRDWARDEHATFQGQMNDAITKAGGQAAIVEIPGS